ncbi:MAG: hypothetical protein M1547_04505 [Gammaproteobacteria bacterium]|nr:hypothetical protein [Gammaproteobacteria bacterium]
MEPVSGEPDVLGKMDALLTRHLIGTPVQQDPASARQQADRATIPVLTEIIAEPDTIPVLTDAIASPHREPPAQASDAGTDNDGKNAPDIEPPPASLSTTGNPAANSAHGEENLRRIEEFMVQQLENRIALEFTATLDRALNELLGHTREHIRHAVREALKQRPAAPPTDTGNDPQQD